MRTQKYIQVEAIVVKYKNLASETEAVKKTQREFTEFFVPADHQRLDFVEQLVGHIYQLSTGKQANEQVVKEYEEYTRYYTSGLISDTEESFLVDNFDVLLDYAFEHLSIYTIGFDFDEPKEWSSLVPYLLENGKGKIFIPNSDNGREFVGLEQCDLVVASRFANAAMRAYACGQHIEQYISSASDEGLWADLGDGMFDAVLVEYSSLNEWSAEDVFVACNRIVKNGGDILFCVSKKVVLSNEMAFLQHYVMEQKMLQEVIQLPSGKILFHFVKKSHDTIVMCDATSLAQKANEKVVDVAAFQKEVKMANMPEREESLIIRRLSYEKLRADILLPLFYLRFPENGTPISEIVEAATTPILSDECTKDKHVVTVNILSKVFSKSRLNVNELPLLRTDRIRRYYSVNGPVVIVAVSDKELAVGYTTDDTTFLVPKNLYVLKPTAHIDVRFLASQILKSSVQEQLVSLVYGKGHGATLADSWSNLVRIEIPSIEQQQKLVQDMVLKDFALQERYVEEREKGFRHSISLRKHALSQNISAFDSLFCSLAHCMQEHNGRLKSNDLLAPVSTMTVGEAMEIMRSKLRTICERVAQLTDEQDWGKCEFIEPQQFIERYEREHHDSKFIFKHLWDEFDTNCFAKDVFDKKTGKLLCRTSKEEIEKSLQATWDEEHLFEMRQSDSLYQFYQQFIAECDAKINEKSQCNTPPR